MAGGDPELVNSCIPILQLFSSKIFHFGPVGAGMAAKLVNQALVGIHAQAASEALTLAKQFGIKDTQLLADMLKNSWGQSKVAELVLDDAIKVAREGAHILRNTAAPLRNLQKDFACIQQDLKPAHTLDGHMKLPLTEHTAWAINEACESGLKDSAFISLMDIIAKDSR